MPLLDHFNPPLSRRRQWRGMFSAFAVMVAGQLNKERMPNEYNAQPHVKFTDVVEVEPDEYVFGPASESAETWRVSTPAAVLAADFANGHAIEVRVHDDWQADPVAVVTFVTPTNTESPARRRAFAARCASHLQLDASLVVVDLVTLPHPAAHPALLHLIGVGESAAGAPAPTLSATTYRTVRTRARTRLEIWQEPLAVGKPFPVVPVWLAEDVAVPLNLETSYREMCEALRLPE
jgi:hypothetical protein